MKAPNEIECEVLMRVVGSDDPPISVGTIGCPVSITYGRDGVVITPEVAEMFRRMGAA